MIRKESQVPGSKCTERRFTNSDLKLPHDVFQNALSFDKLLDR